MEFTNWFARAVCLVNAGWQLPAVIVMAFLAPTLRDKMIALGCVFVPALFLNAGLRGYSLRLDGAMLRVRGFARANDIDLNTVSKFDVVPTVRSGHDQVCLMCETDDGKQEVFYPTVCVRKAISRRVTGLAEELNKALSRSGGQSSPET